MQTPGQLRQHAPSTSSASGDLLAQLSHQQQASSNAKGSIILQETAKKLNLAIKPPTMYELKQWLDDANIEALELSMKTHGREVAALASLSTDPHTTFIGILHASWKNQENEFVALLKKMGITVESDMRNTINTQIVRMLLGSNYPAITQIHRMVTFAECRDLVPETGIIPENEKTKAAESMEQHLYYWLTEKGNHVNEGKKIGKQILELASTLGINLNTTNVAERVAKFHDNNKAARCIYFITDGLIDVPEATFQNLVNYASHNTSGWTNQSSDWVKPAKIHAQQKGWSINFEEPMMEEVVNLLSSNQGAYISTPSVNKYSNLQFIRQDKIPALNFQPTTQPTKENAPTPDRSKWKAAILDQFAELATNDLARGHFMYGARIDIPSECLEAAKEIGIEISEKEIIARAHEITVEKLLRGEQNTFLKNIVHKCAELGLRATELECEKPTYAPKFIRIMEREVAKILIDQAKHPAESENQKDPTEIQFAKNIGINFDDQVTFMQHTFEQIFRSAIETYEALSLKRGGLQTAKKMLTFIQQHTPAYNAKSLIQSALETSIRNGNTRQSFILLNWLKEIG